jgi:predicted alpha-1,6-mannanase (GH76 family)
VYESAYVNTPVIVGECDPARVAPLLRSLTPSSSPPPSDNCYDDHQWWLLAWVSVYRATLNVTYLERAAAVFDFIVGNGWSAICGGGVDWCPVSGSRRPYKNAVTSELFFDAAMGLYPYTELLGRPAAYYSGWAAQVSSWLLGSGIINSALLVNDGLTDACANNGQTTWTYNQMLFDALWSLGVVSVNATLTALAESLFLASSANLSSNGVLVEPCTNCDGDQIIFKGVYVRHLGVFGVNDAAIRPAAAAFLMKNVDSLLANAVCAQGGYGFDWRGAPGGCDATQASSSAALDLLLAAAVVAPSSTRQWQPIGLGNCVDAAGQSMSNCFSTGASEAQCANAGAGAVAYDWEQACDGSTFCRVRTLEGAGSCLPGWQYESGVATTVVGGSGGALALCVVRSK